MMRGALVSVWDWRCHGHDSIRDEVMHADFEVVFTRRGAFSREVRGVRSVADMSVASFWSGGEEFRIKHLSAMPDHCTILRFTPAAVRELFEAVTPGSNDRSILKFPATHAPVSSAQYLELHQSFSDTIAQGQAALEAEERAIELAIGVLEIATSTAVTFATARARTTAIEFAHRVRELVASRYLEPISLSQISRDVCCSPFHLSRMMVAAEGIRIHQLVVRLRLREALRRLLDTPDPISAIAQQTGFSSHSHFGAAFRREFGVTPRSIRQKSLAGSWKGGRRVSGH